MKSSRMFTFIVVTLLLVSSLAICQDGKNDKNPALAITKVLLSNKTTDCLHYVTKSSMIIFSGKQMLLSEVFSNEKVLVSILGEYDKNIGEENTHSIYGKVDSDWQMNVYKIPQKGSNEIRCHTIFLTKDESNHWTILSWQIS